MDCTSDFANKTISNMYCVRHRLAVGALKLSKRGKNGQNEGQKYKNDNFEANRDKYISPPHSPRLRSYRPLKYCIDRFL